MGTCQSSGSQAWVVILVGPFNLQSKLKTIPAKKIQPTENPMFKARVVEAARYTKYPSPTGTAFPCKFHGPKKSIPQKCSVGNTGRLGPSVTRASPMSEKRGGRCEGGSARHAGPSVVTAFGGIQTQKEGLFFWQTGKLVVGPTSSGLFKANLQGSALNRPDYSLGHARWTE